MFALRIGSRYVVLDTESTLSLEINNPLFETELLPGDWTLPFTVPDHPTNNIIFNLPKDISNTAEFEQAYDAELYIGGNLYSLGRINVTMAEQGRYSLVFGNEISRLKAALENKKLNEFDYGGLRTFGTTTNDIIAHAKTVSSAAPLVYDYAFPLIKNNDFYNGKNADFGSVINFYSAGAYAKNALNNNAYALVPMPYIHYLLNTLFAEAGLLLRGDFMEDAEMKQLIAYSNYAIDRKDPHAVNYANAILATPPAANNSGTVVFDNDSTGGGVDTDSNYNTGNGKYVAPITGSYRLTIRLKWINNDPSDYGPTYTLSISPRVNNAGGGYNFTLLSKGVHYDETISVIVAGVPTDYFTAVWQTSGFGSPPDVNIEIDSTFTIESIANDEQNLFSNEIDLVNHVPDMLATDFILAIFSTFKIKPKFDPARNICYLNYAKTIMASPAYSNITRITRPFPTIEKEKHQGFTFDFDFENPILKTLNGKTVMGTYAAYQALPDAVQNTIAYIENTNQIFVATFNSGTNTYFWEFFTDNYYPLKIGNGGTEIKPALELPLMRLGVIGSGGALFPEINEPGSSLFFNNGVTLQSKLILMFYRGMSPDSLSATYPLASTSRYDYAGTANGSYTLRWDGDYGLYKIFHQAFIEFIMKARLLTHTIDFTTAHLGTIDVFEKQLIHQTQYFISRIPVNLKPNSIEPATVETYSIQ